MPNGVDPAKRLAIKLFALHEEDRSWILGQLSTEARTELLLLIEELSSLGVQLDSADFARMFPEQLQHIQKMPSISDDLRMIDQADLSQIDIIFDGEPTILLQHLLAIHKWRWLPENDLRHGKFQSKTASALDARPTNAVQQALIKAVAVQLQQQVLFAPSAKPYRAVHHRPTALNITHKLKAFLSWAR